MEKIEYAFDEKGFLNPTKPFPKNMTQLEAVKESIRKWETVVEFCKEADSSDRRPACGVAGCALCALYINAYCLGCPINEVSGAIYCCETPFDDYCNAYSARMALPHAEREVAFLKEILANLEQREQQNGAE